MRTARISLAILALAGLPVLALASGDHAGHHAAPAASAPDMAAMHASGMHKDMHASMAGKPGDPAQVSRTVKVTMDDSMRFDPGTLNVKAGETVRFFIVNQGRLPHEMVIGTADELTTHAQQMRAMPDMKHEDPSMIRLAPGQRGGIVWRFDQAGTVSYACLVPGHMEAGMVGRVEVE